MRFSGCGETSDWAREQPPQVATKSSVQTQQQVKKKKKKKI
jgi:hypothetical protein